MLQIIMGTYLMGDPYNNDNDDNKMANEGTAYSKQNGGKSKDNYLELGDIIQIISPSNAELHQNKYYIYYLDLKEIGILNIETFEQETLYFDANQYLTDESIDEIRLINRSDQKGYARQNGLVVGKWIDIHFGGEIPQIITCNIVDLEEDMIELQTTDGISLYIDFEYKGIPKELFIEKIIIREPPTRIAKQFLQPKDEETMDKKEDILTTTNENGETTMEIPENIQINKEITEELEILYLDTEAIFEAEWFEATILQEVAEKDRKYSFEEQIASLKDELLSKIPHHKRTPEVEHNIHLHLRRYKDLYLILQKKTRENPATNKTEYVKRDENYKPILDEIDNKLSFPSWIIPVIKQNRQLFSALPVDDQQALYEQGQIEEIDEQGNSYLLSSSFIQQMASTYRNYIMGKQVGDENRLILCMKNILQMFRTSQCIVAKNSLLNCAEIDEPTETVESNNDDFYYQNNDDQIGKFYLQKKILGYTYPNSVETTNGIAKTNFRKLVSNDKITITSLLTLPKPFILHSYIANNNSSIYDQVNLSFISVEKGRLLNENTKEIDKIIVEENGDEIDHLKLKTMGQKTFLTEIKEFTLQQNRGENEEETMFANNKSKKTKLKKVLNSIIPSVAQILQYFNTEIREQPTFHNILQYLQLFNISHKQLNSRENKKIQSFLRECKKEFKAKKEERKRLFEEYLLHSYDKDNYKKKSNLISNIIGVDWKTMLENAYGDGFETDSDFIQLIKKMDGGMLYGYILRHINEKKNEAVDIFSSSVVASQPAISEEQINEIPEIAKLNEIDRMTKETLEKAKEYLLQKKISQYIEKTKQTKTQHAFGKTFHLEKIPISPFAELRETILNYPDFSKKQDYIVQFVTEFCRPFIVNDNKESPHWYYCKATNLPLFPVSLYELAIAYLRDGSASYLQKLDEICAKKGILAEDIIIDKETNFELKKLDDVFQETYNEEGFRVISYSVIEQNEAEKTEEMLYKALNSKTVLKLYDNENMQNIYNIYLAIMKNLNLDAGLCDSFLLRISSILISIPSYLPTEKQYLKAIVAKGKQNTKSYQSYKNERLVYCVGAVLHIAIQTAIIDTKKAKVFSGCAKSFSGFPLMGAEDTSGLNYMSCVLKGTAGNTELWQDIFKKKKEDIFAQLYNIISKYLLVIPEVDEAINRKKQYIAENGILIEDIPQELSVKKWILFLPPLIPTKMKALQSVGSNTNSVIDLQKINTLNASIHQHTYAVVEMINGVVNKSATILNTSSGIPFLDNACCESGSTHPLTYFKNKAGELMDVYFKRIEKNSSQLKEWNMKPPILFSVAKNEDDIIAKNENIKITDEVIYGAFIKYCNLENNFAIPEDVIGFFAKKMEDFPKTDKFKLDEKIEFLKKNGKDFNESNLKELVRIISKRTLQPPDFINDTHKNSVDIFKKGLLYLKEKRDDYTEGEGIPPKLCDLFLDILEHFNKSRLYSEKKELNQPMQKAIYKLKEYLTVANQSMLATITSFLSSYPQKETSNKRNKCIEHIRDGVNWDILKTAGEDRHLYLTVINSIKNSMYIYLSLLPSQISNNRKYKTMLKEWGLSQNNYNDLTKVVDRFYNPLSIFFAEDSERTSENQMIKQFYKINSEWMNDLQMLVRIIPTFQSVWVGGEEYNVLFGRNIILQIYQYCWLSMFQDSITSLERVDMEKINRTELKKQHTKQLLFAEEMKEFTRGMEIDNDNDYYGMFEKTTMKNAIGLFIVGFLQQNIETKKMLDISYEEIIQKKNKVISAEKKKITDHFANLTDAERRTEHKKKTLGLDMWYINQKKLIVYSEEVYDRDREINEEYRKIEKIVETGEGDDFNDVLQDDFEDDFAMRNPDEYDGNEDFDENEGDWGE
jgi:hypothetical protein